VPIASVALYVPCGKGSFPSVMAHVGTPAVVAAVPRVVVLCPPVPGTDDVDPAVLYAAHALGLEEVYRVNGPSGIAAAALGTTRIPRVRKIVGPGSPAVMVAQLLAQERGVLTNVLQGPSESMVLADGSADVELLTVDLLTEAEHGRDSAVTLVTWSIALADAVAARLALRLAQLPEPQRSNARSSLTDLGGILLVADEEEGCRFADEYAVEHLQIATKDPEATLRRVRYAAEILIGQHTPMAAANFTIGVPNTLPSGGYAQVSSGVTVRTFLTTSSLARLTAAGLASLGGSARRIAEHEGFPAHVSALTERGL
jgi:histidinol dehydrogenase